MAIGFRAGEPADGGWVVRGRDAHAWVEVHLGDRGWVSFDPTPAASWSPGAAGTFTLGPAVAVPATSVGATDASTTTVAAAATSVSPAVPHRTGRAGEVVAPRGSTSLLPLPLVALGAGLLGAAAIMARGHRRRRRRRRSDTDTKRIQRAWEDAVTSLQLVGLWPRSSETPTEFARRAQGEGGLALDELGELAEVTTAARYGPSGTEALGGHAVVLAERVATTVAEAVPARSTRTHRLRHRLRQLISDRCR